MKKVLSFLICILVLTNAGLAQVAINHDDSEPDISAMLDVKSNIKGFLPPRMTFTEMNSIIRPSTGLMVFCTSTSQYYFNKGTSTEPDWVSHINLPFSGTFSSTITLFDITNTGSAGAGSFAISNESNSSPSLLAQTSGTGNAATFKLLNPLNLSTAVSAEAISGNAMIAYNFSSTNATIWSQNDGSSTSLYTQSLGGNAIFAKNSSPSFYTLWAENDSTGPVLGLIGTYGFGIYAENFSDSNSTILATNRGNFTAIASQAQGGHALFAENSSPESYTIWAKNYSTGPVLGLNSTSGQGLYVENTSASNSTLYAKNNGTYTTMASIASAGNAMYAENESSSSYAIWAQNNADGPTLGLSANGGNTLYAQNNSSTKSTIYASNTGTFTTLAAIATSGNAIYASNSSNFYSTLYAKNNASEGSNAIYAENSSTYPAIYGSNIKTSGDRSGGYFSAGSSAYAWVGANFSGTNYKITGTGTVATIVETPDKDKVSMFCSESPEILLTDYGTGTLIHGKSHILLDPVFSNNIIVSDLNPMKVFVQLEGDCKGVYVTNKTSRGFDVIELQDGQSNVPFSWSVVANRCDETDSAGNLVSKNAGVRFPKSPSPRIVPDESGTGK